MYFGLTSGGLTSTGELPTKKEIRAKAIDTASNILRAKSGKKFRATHEWIDDLRGRCDSTKSLPVPNGKG